jgi:hypothetical protein
VQAAGVRAPIGQPHASSTRGDVRTITQRDHRDKASHPSDTLAATLYFEDRRPLKHRGNGFTEFTRPSLKNCRSLTFNSSMTFTGLVVCGDRVGPAPSVVVHGVPPRGDLGLPGGSLSAGDRRSTGFQHFRRVLAVLWLRFGSTNAGRLPWTPLSEVRASRHRRAVAAPARSLPTSSMASVGGQRPAGHRDREVRVVRRALHPAP